MAMAADTTPFLYIERVQTTGGRAREPFSRRIGRLSSSALATQLKSVRRTRIVVRTGGATRSSDSEIRHMTDIRERRIDEEPMGIVISRGSRAESTPRFAAYIWSQVGEITPTMTEPKAA